MTLSFQSFQQNSTRHQVQMEKRAEQALKTWQEAKTMWSNSATRHELCHPWSETDYMIRLKSFEGFFGCREAQRLASEGFHRSQDGSVICTICRSSIDTDGDHKPLCPWRGRPYAHLKSSWHIEHSPSDTLFDHCRHSLGAMEDIKAAMKSISLSRYRG